jgi:hypothetical protein
MDSVSWRIPPLVKSYWNGVVRAVYEDLGNAEVGAAGPEAVVVSGGG